MQKAPTIRLAIAFLAPLIGHAQSGHTKVVDAMVLPDETRTFCSRNKRCVLTIKTLDHWRTPYPTATLSVNGKPKWERKVENWRGPRTACVSDSGRVALFDEWPNIPSERAITVISTSGSARKTWSFDQVVAAAGVHRSDVPPHAKAGVWLGGMPIVKNEAVHIQIAGVNLVLELSKPSLTKSL